jgi:hypothetical protein
MHAEIAGYQARARVRYGGAGQHREALGSPKRRLGQCVTKSAHYQHAYRGTQSMDVYQHS